MATQPLVVLAGPPGAGKSTVAKVLSRLKGVQVRDTDQDVEANAGKPISDIFIDDGEAAFRELEVAAVAAALTSHDGVLALGGGAIMREETQENLARYRSQGGLVVFLDVTLSHAAPRVGFNQARPLLLGNPRAQWKILMDQRRPTYEAVANFQILTDGKSPQEVAQAISAELARLA
ncbi:shikimate kinase [Populibacterium corticicola]|jgi:shikimate kinase/3-dehydroquinate synthase|uniref:Shikimate kinase n=1 Tax=Populibacterium corticicola TaxID=1812826 RepID=A0ABW5XEC1_9MICO